MVKASMVGQQIWNMSVGNVLCFGVVMLTCDRYTTCVEATIQLLNGCDSGGWNRAGSISFFCTF